MNFYLVKHCRMDLQCECGKLLLCAIVIHMNYLKHKLARICLKDFILYLLQNLMVNLLQNLMVKTHSHCMSIRQCFHAKKYN